MEKLSQEKSEYPFYSVDVHDIIYIGSTEASKVEQMIKEQYVEAHHDRAIFYAESRGQWRTYIGEPRREVKRKNKDDLIDFLYQYYKTKEISERARFFLRHLIF